MSANGCVHRLIRSQRNILFQKMETLVSWTKSTAAKIFLLIPLVKHSQHTICMAQTRPLGGIVVKIAKVLNWSRQRGTEESLNHTIAPLTSTKRP
jgi:hypothetical protein